jgi:Ca2+-binding RTX toxin-like protein
MQYDWRRRHPYTNLCPHTGLTIPECSCPACTERQIARAKVRTQARRGSGRTNLNAKRRQLRVVATIGVLVLAALLVPVGSSAHSNHRKVDGVRARVKHGTLRVKGSHRADAVALRLKAGDPTRVEVDVANDGSPDFSFARGGLTAINVRVGNGDDSARVDDANGAFTDSIPTTIAGGRGDDSLEGGQVQVAAENETFRGGKGNDRVDGGKGNDTALLGRGNDTFRWDNGEGSDVIEGQRRSDTMLFNGADVAENVTMTANGGRLTFFRVQGNVTMDTDGVETIDDNALGGADIITVNDLTDTDVTQTNLDLAGTLGGSAGDAAVDNVVVNGTDGDDSINIDGNGSGAEVTGLATAVSVKHADQGDSVSVNTLAGADNVVATGVFGALQVLVDGAPV